MIRSGAEASALMSLVLAGPMARHPFLLEKLS